MTRTFRSPRTYHPSYSLLGRAVRAWVGDRLRGEALFVVVLAGLTLGVLMAHYLGWALLQPMLAAHPSWQVLFWGGQVLSGVVLAGVGLVGFRPAVRVECGPEAVALTQGGRRHTVPYASVEAISVVSARRHHRHHRRYAATRIFVSRIPQEVLLLRTDEGPVVVALADAEAQAALFEHLGAACSSSPAPVAQQA